MKQILTCAIVDDSELQRMAIAKLVKDHPNLDLKGSYSAAEETAAALTEEPVDLLFLDIILPKADGFELLDLLNFRPGVIFITEQPTYALQAFDYAAVDYLKKPVQKTRFLYAVERALLLHQHRKKELEREPAHIFVRSNLKDHKVYLKEITHVEACGDYIELHAGEDTYKILSSMKAFMQNLPEKEFMRIHKSYIVNLARVTQFDKKNVFLGALKFPLSRAKKNMLRSAMRSREFKS
jgi:DNA-binding LytR/AlgR family response regulator